MPPSFKENAKGGESAQSKLDNYIEDVRKVDRQFTPEYRYSHFFFGGKYDENDERFEIAGAILHSSKNTRVTFIANAFQKNFVHEQLEMFGLGQMIKSGRITVVGGEGKSVWAQDFGERIGKNIYVSGNQNMPRVRPLPSNIIEAPISIDGGNICLAVNRNNEKVVVVGWNAVKKSAMRNEADVQSVKRAYVETFGADDILVLGEQQGLRVWDLEGKTPGQTRYAFHIDQAVFFPKNGLAVMIRPEGLEQQARGGNDGAYPRIPEDFEENRLTQLQNMLNQYKEQLENAGFRVVEIPTTLNHYFSFMSYTNSITITEESGRQTIIMPSFPNSLKIEKNIREILEKEGFGMIFIKNKSYGLRGNTHCLTGAIAFFEFGRKERGAESSHDTDGAGVV